MYASNLLCGLQNRMNCHHHLADLQCGKPNNDPSPTTQNKYGCSRVKMDT
jgi:hypothetical protein